MTSCRLYLITPPRLEPRAFADTLKSALEAGDVASLQLRLKDVSDDEIRRATEILMPIAQTRDVAFLMNDRPDLAAELGCDGIHIGQEDASYAAARAAVGPDRIVGVTCHDSRHLAMEAAEAGAMVSAGNTAACLLPASPLASYVSGANLVVDGGGQLPAFLSAARPEQR